MQTVEQLQAEVSTLKGALELLGFDSNAVSTLLQGDGDRMWREMPFRLTAVRFDAAKASESGLSENGVAATEHVFEGLRRA
ncbi:hypothetical protein [Burkholderia multivorans]|uniref:hypothetical protein n=1 Tax=Burkholderia multivorans TaxID=87883 RepID=UPI000B015465|nr:hypothetical protein [Burkholderia multivorans]MDR9230030.1 hypothetical protein [Burkholderia multivorans]HDR9474394.1 hypothetical protein [Burkholderia multivorans]HDR9480236.1 hypothetical protein [Burkholderia multivorans]